MHKTPSADRSVCEIPIRVRYAETDAMGYLHHAQYLVYFEMGRTELLRHCGISYREMEERGFFYVVARIAIRYRAPARYDDLLTLTTLTTRISPIRIDHEYRLTRGGELLTEGDSTLVCVGRNGKPLALPDEIFDMMLGLPASKEASE